MKTQNKVELIGYVGKDPAVFTLPSGDKKVNFRLATHVPSKKDNGETEWVPTWHNVVAMRSKAETALTHFIKGSHVMVIGSLVYRNYTDKEGISRMITEIVASRFIDLDR